MAKVNVYIEETLCKKIEFWVPDDLTVEERMEFAEEKAREAYEDNQIVLTADDFTGIVHVMVKDEESGIETNWTDL